MIIEVEDKLKTRPLYEEAFDDPKAFVDYYYEDRCLDNRILVSMEDDEIVSMLHLNPYKVNLCGSVVQSYYIVAVATKENRRHKGHMRRLFERAFEMLKAEHIPFVFLLPVDEAIYSWMGFEKICDFTMDRISDYEEIRNSFDIYCVRDDDYIRRMTKENDLRSQDEGEGLPDNPIIMAKITDIDSFNAVAGTSFSSEAAATDWLKKKKIYICEEV